MKLTIPKKELKEKPLEDLKSHRHSRTLDYMYKFS